MASASPAACGICVATGEEVLTTFMARSPQWLGIWRAAEVGTTWTLAYTVPGLAVLAARSGRLELAAELFAAGSATAEAGAVAVTFPPDLELAARWLPVVRTELGEDAFRRAWEVSRFSLPWVNPR